MSDDIDSGDAWVYESLVGALPGIDLTPSRAVAIQFAGFELGVLAFGWVYGLRSAAVAGTVGVAVAAAGSAFMLDLGARVRALPSPEPYRRLLFGSSVEVVLGLLAYVGLLTYLFAYDPRDGTSLVADLLGARPPAPAVFLFLLIVWDVCYRIGTAWWAAVAGLYRSWRFRFDRETAAAFRGLDRRIAGFGVLQLALVPVVREQPLLAALVVGHVVAVLAVVGASAWRSRSTAT